MFSLFLSAYTAERSLNWYWNCLLIQISPDKVKEAAKFAQLWNKIIESLREEDLINNR